MHIRSTLFVLLCALVFAPVHASGKETGVINLARLSIARVSASSVNGDRPLDNPYYGVQNMFDDGRNWINGINYSYWLGEYNRPRQFVTVCFDVPVTVSKLVIEFENEPKPSHSEGQEHREYALQITTIKGKTKDTDYYDSKSAAGFVSATTFPKPLRNVRQIKVLLSGFYCPSIQEIRILGTPPAHTNTTAKTPQVVGDPTHKSCPINKTDNDEETKRSLNPRE